MKNSGAKITRYPFFNYLTRKSVFFYKDGEMSDDLPSSADGAAFFPQSFSKKKGVSVSKSGPERNLVTGCCRGYSYPSDG